MLVRLTVTAIAGYHLKATTQDIIFNSENMFDWESLTSGSRFRYVLNPQDRREKAMLVTVSDTIASKLAAANTAWGDVMVKLPVEKTLNATPTDRYIPVKTITWCEEVDSEADHVYVKYCEGGFKVVEVMVPFSLNDMLTVASTGTSSK